MENGNQQFETEQETATNMDTENIYPSHDKGSIMMLVQQVEREEAELQKLRNAKGHMKSAQVDRPKEIYARREELLKRLANREEVLKRLRGPEVSDDESRLVD